MIAEVRADRDLLADVLQSLSVVVSGDADVPLDINMVTENESIKLYVRKFNNIQVLHELKPSENIQIDINEPSELVFSSETLLSLIKSAEKGQIRLRLSETDFRVKSGSDWFSTASEFKLPLFNESEFTPPIEPQNFTEITEVEREPLIQNLQMMSNISPVVNFRVKDGEFWISVSDAVQGEGKVMKQIDGRNVDSEREYSYELKSILDFAKSLNTSQLVVHISETGALMLTAEQGSQKSHLLLSHRIGD